MMKADCRSVMQSKIPDPIFEIGQLPVLIRCEVIRREYLQGEWHYYVRNLYYMSSTDWATEDLLIKEIITYQGLH